MQSRHELTGASNLN